MAGVRRLWIALLATFYTISVQANAITRRSNGGDMPRLPYGTSVFNASQLPAILATKTDLNQDTRSIETIRNKLALYTFALDGKRYETLEQVFSDSAVYNFVGISLGTVSTLNNITTTLREALEPVSSQQHQLGSIFVEFVDSHNAYSVSYYQSIQFGSGSYINESVYSYGQYQDSWYRRTTSSQDWLIQRRNEIYTTPVVGNTSIFS